MNKNIIAINPWFYDFKGYDEWMKPLGLLQICAILKENGYKTALINCLDRNDEKSRYELRETDDNYGCGKFPAEELQKPDIYRTIKRKYKRYGIPVNSFTEKLKKLARPQAIIVSSLMTYWYQGVFDVIAAAKSIFPNVPVILGGIYASLCKQHAIENSRADHVITGSSADSLLQILEDITGVKKLRSYETPQDYPMPEYLMLNNPKSIPVSISSGCPFRCSYCASSVLYPEFHAKNAEKSANRLVPILKGLACKNIAFYDDALLVNYEQHCSVFLETIKKHLPDIMFHTPNAMHAKFIDRKTAIHMKANGFTTLRLGFEFADRDMQIKSGGKVSGKDIETAVANLLSAGFAAENIALYIMCGTPGTNTKSIENAINTCKDLNVMSQLVEYSPIPGTAMWNDFPGTDTELSKDPLFHNNTYHIYNGTVISLDDYNNIKGMSLANNTSLLRQ